MRPIADVSRMVVIGMGLKFDIMCAIERIQTVWNECQDTGEVDLDPGSVFHRLMEYDVHRLQAHVGSVLPEVELRREGDQVFPGDWVIGVECGGEAPFMPVESQRLVHGRVVLVDEPGAPALDAEAGGIPGRVGIVLRGGAPAVVVPLCRWPHGAELI